jgi:hypothetical protein
VSFEGQWDSAALLIPVMAQDFEEVDKVVKQMERTPGVADVGEGEDVARQREMHEEVQRLRKELGQGVDSGSVSLGSLASSITEETIIEKVCVLTGGPVLVDSACRGPEALTPPRGCGHADRQAALRTKH